MVVMPLTSFFVHVSSAPLTHWFSKLARSVWDLKIWSLPRISSRLRTSKLFKDQGCLFFPKRLRTTNSFKGCLIVVWNFRPHVVWAKRLAKLKRPTDFNLKCFWAKIKELGTNRLSVIFPKKGRYRNQIFAFKDTDRLPVSLYSPNVLKKVLQFHIVFQPSPTSQNDRDDSW